MTARPTSGPDTPPVLRPMPGTRCPAPARNHSSWYSRSRETVSTGSAATSTNSASPSWACFPERARLRWTLPVFMELWYTRRIRLPSRPEQIAKAIFAFGDKESSAGQAAFMMASFFILRAFYGESGVLEAAMPNSPGYIFFRELPVSAGFSSYPGIPFVLSRNVRRAWFSGNAPGSPWNDAHPFRAES